MECVAFKMKPHPAQQAEFKRCDDASWPACAEILAAHGIRDDAIFGDPATDILLATNRKTAMKRLQEPSGEPLMQEWSVHMSATMDANPDLTPVRIPLDRVFNMD